MISKRFMVPALALMPIVLMFVAAGPGAKSASAAPLLIYGQEPWEVPPGEFNDIQRRGFHDGVEGARKDYGNHRRPDVDNREEYRNSDLPPDLREPYRAAFRRGYQMAASHLWGTPPPPPPLPPPVAEPPRQDWDERGAHGLEGDAERQGYREGSQAAHKDFEMQRRPDPDEHESYRNPHVPPGLADEYREGFMRGYEVTLSQVSGQPVWQIHGEPGQWTPPPQFNEMQRQGFHDGVEGAQKDFGNHRHPNVLNRDEYREPRVPQEFWREYQEGFRRGYELTAARLWGGE